MQLALALLVLLLPIAFLVLRQPSAAIAACFDDSFSYRTGYTIGNTGSADSNKKVKFDIDTATLITAGKLQSDCDDIRFTDAGGNLLKYFLDSTNGACNAISTYLRVDSLSGSNLDVGAKVDLATTDGSVNVAGGITMGSLGSQSLLGTCADGSSASA